VTDLCTAHPPLCRPAFHIGVIADPGCATRRLDAIGTILAALADAVRDALATSDTGSFAPGPPLLRCLIVLAAPADRLVAKRLWLRGSLCRWCCRVPVTTSH
jgi:hypothetical protein